MTILQPYTHLWIQLQSVIKITSYEVSDWNDWLVNIKLVFNRYTDSTLSYDISQDTKTFTDINPATIEGLTISTCCSFDDLILPLFEWATKVL